MILVLDRILTLVISLFICLRVDVPYPASVLALPSATQQHHSLRRAEPSSTLSQLPLRDRVSWWHGILLGCAESTSMLLNIQACRSASFLVGFRGFRGVDSDAVCVHKFDHWLRHFIFRVCLLLQDHESIISVLFMVVFLRLIDDWLRLLNEKILLLKL